jgi:Tfp pilus assembly protein PilF
LSTNKEKNELGALLIVPAILAAGLAIVAWRAGWDRRVLVAATGLAVLLGLAGIALRSGDLAGPATAPDAMLAASAMAFNSPGMPAGEGAVPTAGALPELAERLAARLAASPDDPQGWSLLAATYRQLGRDEEAAQAEKKAIDSGADPAAIASAHQQAVGSAPAWAPAATVMTTQAAGAKYVIEGQRLKVQRKFREAELEFRKAVEADPRDADSWADVADCAAAAAGNDLTAGRDAIDRALAINPQHRKALWLRASLALQEGRYAAAAETWRTLSGLVAEGSPDARVIAANIAEADALAATAGG